MPDEKEPTAIATSDQTAVEQITSDETSAAIAARRQDPPPAEVKTYYPPGRSRQRWVPENA